MSEPWRAWMPLHIGAYLRDTQELTTIEHGAYMLLIMHYWTKGALPQTDKQLAAITRLSLRQWSAVKGTLAPFFRPDWTHKKIEEELKQAADKYHKRANAGSTGGQTTASRARHRGSNAGSNGGSNAGSEAGTNKHKTKSSNEDLGAFDFERFFESFEATFPKHVGPDGVRAELEIILAEQRATPDDLLAGAKRYAVACAGTEEKFIASPKKWLLDGRWKDGQIKREVEPVKSDKTFVQTGDPKWPALHDRYRREKGRGPPEHNGGWHFSNTWIEELREGVV